MLTDQVHRQIITFVEALNPEVYVVDLRLKRGKKNVLSMRLDTDKGITMTTVGRISRKLGHWLEEEEILDFEYGMEISSPGVGEPLVLTRQYSKNIGRLLKVTLSAGGEIIGKLAGVDEDQVAVLPVIKPKGNHKGRKVKFSEEEKLIRFEDIKESKVVLDIK